MVKVVKFGVCVVNDDQHSFDFVIQSLQEIFSWDTTQAANCALLVDARGEFVVKWYDQEQPALMAAQTV